MKFGFRSRPAPRARRLAPLLATATALLLGGSLLGTPAAAQISRPVPPATFTVNTNDDLDTGGCTTTHCSLREAIAAANYIPTCLVVTSCRNLINFQLSLADALTIAVTSPLPSVTGSITFDGNNLPTFQTIVINGQTFTIEIAHPGRLQISGSLSSTADGLKLAHTSGSLGTIVQNLQVTGFTGSGIHQQSSGNTVINANIAGNGGAGINIEGSNNLVRASTIQNNRGTGISAGNATGNAIFGSTITGNSFDGVAGFGMTVGSPSVADRNIISGNGGCGVRVLSVFGSGVTPIVGNYIGVDATGTSALPNARDGVCASGGGAQVGGSGSGAGNLISGNSGNGIFVDASPTSFNSAIQGNLIGTDATGTAPIPNALNGIKVTGQTTSVSDSISPNVTIVSNVVSGNKNNGIGVFGGFKHMIQSNIIGTDASGTLSIPNQFNGIFIDDARSVTVGAPVGSADATVGNHIAKNFGAGVSVFTETSGSVNSVGNTVRANSISANTRLGMDLVPLSTQLGFGVVTQPAALHPDNGPNRLQNLPQLTAAVRTTSTTSGDNVLVAGNMFSNLAGGGLVVDLYASNTCDLSGFGQGQQFLGSATPALSGVNIGGTLTLFGAFQVSLPTSPRLSDGTVITATVTSGRGDTSEFSHCFVVDSGTGAPTLSPARAIVAPEQELGYTFSWTLPAPRPWRQLANLDLRLRDPATGTIPLLVRWDQSSNTLSLFDENAGKFGPSGALGEPQMLADGGVRVDLAHASAVGSGATGQSVTLALPLTLNARFADHTYIVEVAATDDAGQRSDFAPAGTLQVTR